MHCLLLLLVLLVPACASTSLTPTQERAYDRFQKCKAVTNSDHVRFTRIELDGRLWYTGPSVQMAAMGLSGPCVSVKAPESGVRRSERVPDCVSATRGCGEMAGLRHTLDPARAVHTSARRCTSSTQWRDADDRATRPDPRGSAAHRR